MNRPPRAAPDSMPPTPIEDLSRALARIEAGERTARRNVVIASIIPVMLAVALVGFTAYWVQRSASQVRALNTAKEELATEVDSLQQKNRTLSEQTQQLETLLRDAAALSKFTQPMGFADLKYVASTDIQAGRILEVVLRLKERDVKWRLGGRSPREGFDSPGFAAFVLRDLGLLPGVQGGPPGGEGGPPALRTDPGGWLHKHLPAVEQPRPGDLVFYESGYAMFYFRKPGAQPFVIGMTPFGITSLVPDFAKRTAVRRVAS